MHHLRLLLPILLALDRAGSDHTDPAPAIPGSDHEFPRDVVNPRPYPGKGVWKRPPAHIDVGFVPEQTYSQVRKTFTVLHLPQSDALASATTDEEVLNAPRLREVVKHTTIREVYEEEGFGDNAYDHAGYKKTGEHDEAYAIGESAKKKRSGLKGRSPDSEGQHSQPVALLDAVDGSAPDAGNRNVRAGKVTHQMEIRRGVEKTMEGGGKVTTGSIVRGSNEPTTRSSRGQRPRTRLLRGEVDDNGRGGQVRSGRPPSIKGGKNVANATTKAGLKKRESRQDSDEDLNQFADDVNKDMEDADRNRDPTKNKYLEAREEEERLRLEDEEREAEIQQHYLETSADILKGFPKIKTGIDHDKFPFYASTKNRHSPLRYALHPREIPDKRGREMAFYASKDDKECDEVTAPVVTRAKNELGQPRDKLPRMGQLGDKILCFKNKYWGEEPLDNPFFTEDQPVVVENKKRAIRDEATDTFGDSGFYREIVGSIKHLEAGRFPDRTFDSAQRDLDHRESFASDVYAPPEQRNENFEDIDDEADDDDDDDGDTDADKGADNADVGVAQSPQRPAHTAKPGADVGVERPAFKAKPPKSRFTPKTYPVRGHTIVLDLTQRPTQVPSYPITQPKFRPSPVDERPTKGVHYPRPSTYDPPGRYNPPAKITSPNAVQQVATRAPGNDQYMNVLGMHPPPANAHFQYQTLTYLKPSGKSHQGSRYDTKSLVDSLTMATAQYVADLTSQQNTVGISRTKRDASHDERPADFTDGKHAMTRTERDVSEDEVTEGPKKFYKKRSRFRERPSPKVKEDSREEASTERFVENRDRRKVKQYKVTEDVKEDFGPEDHKTEVEPEDSSRDKSDRSDVDGNDRTEPNDRTTKPKRRRKMRRFKRPLKSKWVNYQAFEVTDKDGTEKRVRWKDGDDTSIEKEEAFRPRKHKSNERNEENRDEFYKEGEGEVAESHNNDNNNDDNGQNEGTTTEESSSHNDTPVDFFSKLKDDVDDGVKTVYRRRKLKKKKKEESDGILDAFSKEAEKKNEENFYKRRKAKAEHSRARPSAAEHGDEAESIDEYVPKYEDQEHENVYADRKASKDERWADRTLDALIGKVRGETREDDDDDGDRRPRKRKNRRRPGANIDDLRRVHGDTLERLRKQHDSHVEVYVKPEPEEDENEEEGVVDRPFGENLDGLIAERLVKLKDNDVPDTDDGRAAKSEKKISTTMTPLQAIASKYPQVWMDKRTETAVDQTDESTSHAVVDVDARKPSRRPKNAPPPPEVEASRYEEYSIDERRREPKYKEAVKEPKHKEAVKEPKHTEAVKGPKHKEAVKGPKHTEAVKGPTHKEAVKADADGNNTQVTIHEEVRLSGEKLPAPMRLSTEEINAKLSAIFKGHKFGSRYNAKKPETNVNTQRKLRADSESVEIKDKDAEETDAKETDAKVNEEAFGGRKNFKPRPRTSTTTSTTTEASVATPRSARAHVASRSKTEDILESKTRDQRLGRRPTFQTTAAASRRPASERGRNRFGGEPESPDEPVAGAERPRRISTTIVPDALDARRSVRERVTLPTFEDTTARAAIRKLSRKSRHKSTTPSTDTLVTTERVPVTDAPKEKEVPTTKAPRRVFIFKKPTTTTTRPVVTTYRTHLWPKKPVATVAIEPEVATNKPVTLRYNIPVKDIVLKKKASKEVETNKIDRPTSFKSAVATNRNIATTTPRVLANFETRRVTNKETFTRIHKLDNDDDEDDEDYDDDDDDDDFYDTYFGGDQDPFQSQRTEKYVAIDDKDVGGREIGFRGDDGHALKDRTLTYVVAPGAKIGQWIEAS